MFSAGTVLALLSLSSDLDSLIVSQVDIFEKRICIEGIKIEGRECGQHGVVGVRLKRWGGRRLVVKDEWALVFRSLATSVLH